MFEEMLYLGLALVLVPLFILLLIGLCSSKKKPICKHCGQEISSEHVRLTDGSRVHKDCFQKMLDDEGRTCPVCGKSMHAGENLYRDSGKWYHQTCYFKSAMEKEGFPPDQVAILWNATRIFCGIPTEAEAVDDFIWAVSDPMYGLYKKSLKKVGQMSQETARATIEKFYLKFPKTVTSFLTGFAVHVPEVAMTIKSLLSILQSEKQVQTTDSLEILKVRYAKGEITKEEYEEMKKTLKES